MPGRGKGQAQVAGGGHGARRSAQHAGLLLLAEKGGPLPAKEDALLRPALLRGKAVAAQRAAEMAAWRHARTTTRRSEEATPSAGCQQRWTDVFYLQAVLTYLEGINDSCTNCNL